MSEKTDASKPKIAPKTAPKNAADTRNARLQAALRDNLRRRKAAPAPVDATDDPEAERNDAES